MKNETRRAILLASTYIQSHYETVYLDIIKQKNKEIYVIRRRAYLKYTNVYINV